LLFSCQKIYWDNPIKLGKIEEIMVNEINKEDFAIISRYRLKKIYEWLSLDNKN